MRFSEKLIGADVKISNENLQVTRKDGCDQVNSNTVAFSNQPLTNKHMQSFILHFNFKIYGFGKIGVTSTNPYNMEFSNTNGLNNLFNTESPNQHSITEFPLFDTNTNAFKNIEMCSTSDNAQLHLLIILNTLGEVHYFINFKYKGILFADNFSAISLWLFFDLSGCLTSVSVTDFNGAPDPGIFWHHDSFGTYYNESTKGSLFFYQTNLTVIHTSKLDEVLCDILDCKCFEDLLDSKRIFLKVICDFGTGSLTPQTFTSKTEEEVVSEDKCHWGYIGHADKCLCLDNSCVQLYDNKTVRTKEKIALFDAEKLAFNMFKKMQNKTPDNGNKKPLSNEISFTDLSNQLPSYLKESIEELPPSIETEKVSLIKKLMLFFKQNSTHSEAKVNGEKSKDIKKPLGKHEKSYSVEIIDGDSTIQNAEVNVDVTVYRSFVQFQIILALGIREPGSHLITIDIDQYLINLDDKNQKQLVKTIEQWLWILYQRGPDQVGPRSVVMVLCYNRSTLDVLNSEKLIPNVQIIKKLATEICNHHEYRTIVNGEPLVFCPSSTNKTEKIDAIKMSIYNAICNSENIPRLIPRKWIKFANAVLGLNYQQTKLLSFSQICQMTDDHDCKNVDDLVTILCYLCHMGVIQWVGDKSYQSLDDPPSINNSRIMEAQASVVVTDKSWLIKIIHGLENSCKSYSNSMETLETVLKSYSYHRLLFVLILKYPLLALESYKKNKLWTVFDYPLEPTDNLYPISLTEKGFTIYFLFNQPIPWISYVSLLLASSRMGSSQDIILLDTSNCSIQIELEDDHTMVVYFISSKTVAATIYNDKYNKIKPSILVRVRQFMEQSIYQVITKNLHRLTGHCAIKCPCNTPCTNHNKRKCNLEYSCLHFLYLDEVLCNQAVFCGRRRIATAPWRELFPPVNTKNRFGDSKSGIIHAKFANNDIWNTESQLGCYLPLWMRTVAKLLNSEESSYNWRMLALKLGYTDKIKKFEEDPNPALTMIVDWITVSGNNQLSVDFILLTLQEAGQYQISDVIESDPECQWLQPQIFISYQWHNQREAREISDYLQKAGFTTWMDVGQMGGGDLLMHRIERAIRGCKVLIACISPRYIVSAICHREIVFADLLKKPIIPVMVLPVPWPPPGGTGLMLAPYIYIDLFGVGGHGGGGLKSDLTSKFTEIEAQVSKHCSPVSLNTESSPLHCIKNINLSTELSKPIEISNVDSHSTEINTSIVQQPSAFTTHEMPVTSQTSVRECSSICTFI